MDNRLFRKFAYEIYVADSSSMTKVAGPISGLKKIVRRLSNRLFSEKAGLFKEKNTELRSLLSRLYGSFKSLEDSILDNDLNAYKFQLDNVRGLLPQLSSLLTMMDHNVSLVENKTVDAVKDSKSEDSDSTPSLSTVDVKPASIFFPPNKEEKDSRYKSIFKNIVTDSGSNVDEVKKEQPVETNILEKVEDSVSKVNQDVEAQSVKEDIIELSETSEPDSEFDVKPKDPEPFLRDRPEWDGVSLNVNNEIKFPINFEENPLVSFKENFVSKFGLDILKSPLLEEDVKKSLEKTGVTMGWKASKNKNSPKLFGSVFFELSSESLKDNLSLIALARLSESGQLSVYRYMSIKEYQAEISRNKESKASLGRMYKYASNLGGNFWQKFVEMCGRLGMDPETILPVMYSESGLDPGAGKGNGAAGLIQFMPFVLKGMGWKGSQDDFRALNGEEQLPLVEKFIRGIMSVNNNKPFKNATEYYVANFWPAAFSYEKFYEQNKGKEGWYPSDYAFISVQSGNPKAVIVESNPKFKKHPAVSLAFERQSYAENKVLDRDGDGIITLGDLSTVVSRSQNSKSYQALINAASKQTGFVASTQKIQPTTEVASLKPEESSVLEFITKNLGIDLNSISSSLMGAFASDNCAVKVLGKKAYAYKFASQVKSELSQYGIVSKISKDGKFFQLSFDNFIPLDELQKICNDLASEFTSKHKSAIVVSLDKPSHAAPLSVESQIILDRMYRLAELGSK